MQTSDTSTACSGSPDDMRTEFIELVGRIVQAEGLPRNAGRILGFLIFDGGAVSFGDLAEQLQISRGSISSGSRLLEEFGLIRRVSKPGERQDYFELEDDPYINLLDRARARAQRAKEAVQKTAAHSSDAPDLSRRISDFANFYHQVESCIGQARQDMKDK